AYAGIAVYYDWLGIMGVLPPQECFQPAIAAASKAVEIDDSLSEGHASLGFSLHAGDHDWEKAEFHLRRSIELNPGNANAYVWYSMVLCTEGRFTDALEFARRSVELDPLTPFNHHNVGWLLYFARRYDEAVVHYMKLASDFPDYGFTHYGLSKIYRIDGRTAEALRESDRTKALMDNSMFALLAEAECLAADGRTEATLEKLDHLNSLATERYVSPYQLALVYCFLNDSESALRCLEEAAEIKEAWLNWASVEPAFDVIRGDERFVEITQRFGYHGFLESSMAGVRKTADPVRPASSRDELHNMTTLVIGQGSDTAETLEVKHSGFSILAGRGPYFLGGVVALVILIVGFKFLLPDLHSVYPSSDPMIKAQNASVLILPFTAEDTANTDVGIGMADALSNRLGNIKSLTVISSNTGRSLADASPEKIESVIGPAFVLTGKLSGPPDNLTLDAELTATHEKKQIWSEQ
ncbi:MAG: TPR end-of-group domain-containing protein, partial [Candidatus Binatia bacterium]